MWLISATNANEVARLEVYTAVLVKVKISRDVRLRNLYSKNQICG